MLGQYDNHSRRCPLLGNDVPFTYCRQPGQESPCRKILDCWWETIDIRSFVSENYGQDMLGSLNLPPKPKILSILEIIEQARKNASN